MSQSSREKTIGDDPSVPIDFVTDSGTAMASANILNVLGVGGTLTSALGNTIYIDSTAAVGVTSITGTANQVFANGTNGSPQMGAVTLTLPQDIATTSSPQFLSLGLATAPLSTATLTLNSASNAYSLRSDGTKTVVDTFIQANLSLGTRFLPSTSTTTVYGIFNNNQVTSPGAGDITTAYGLYSAMSVEVSSVTNAFGVFAQAGSGFMGSTTRAYSIFGGSASGTYAAAGAFAGGVLIGSTYASTSATVNAPNNGLLVQGNTSIGSTTTTSLFNVGSIAQFQINTSGQVISGTWNGTTITPTYGGTGISNPTAHTLPIAEGSSNFTFLGPLTNGQLLIGSTGADPVPATLTAGTGVSITNGAGTISIAISGGGPVNSITATAPLTANGFSGSAQSGSVTIALTTPLALNFGGTNANLTASNGGVFYSTASAGAILSGTATAGQHLQSGANSAPSWTTATFPSTATSTGTILRADGTNWVATTATYPATTTINRLLYSSATNVINEITASNNGVLISGTTGVPSWLAAGTTGQVLIATTGNPASWGTLSGLAVTSISGTANQINASASVGSVTLSLSSTIITPGTLAINGLTTGSVLFSGASSVVSQNNSQFFWDNSNNRLGVTTATPGYTIDASATGIIRMGVKRTDAGSPGGSLTGHWFLCTTADALRWGFGLQDSESGANAGSNLAIFNYTDATPPAFRSTALKITRSNNFVGINNINAVNNLCVSGNAAFGTYAGVSAAPSNGLIVSGQVGIGTASPISTSQIAISSTLAYNTYLTGTQISVDGSSNSAALYVNPSLIPTNGSTISAGIYDVPILASPSTKTITVAAGQYINCDTGSNVGVIASLIPLYIGLGNLTVNGTIQNAYGIYVSQPLSSSSGNYYAAAIQGGQVWFRRAVSGDTTITTKDYIVGVTSTAAARTITLPATAPDSGWVCIVKDESNAAATNNITISRNGRTINGAAANLTINTNSGVFRIYSDGSNYWTW